MNNSILKNKTAFKHLIDNASLMFILLDKKGIIIAANRFAMKVIGESICGKDFKCFIVDFHGDFNLSSVVRQPESKHLLNITTNGGLPQTYYFSFLAQGDRIYACGEVDCADLINREKEIITLNQELSNLTRRLHQQTAQLQRLNDEKANLIVKLQDALDQVKTLEGVVPICSYCKSIRNDGGIWNRVESYLNMYPDADFSHGICPKCAERYHPAMNLNEDG